MALAETFLIYSLTLLSLLLTIKGIKTGLFTIYHVSTYLVGTFRQSVDSLQSSPTLLSRIKSTLMPFVDKNYYKKLRRKRMIQIVYGLNFMLGIFLIFTFFWSLLTADIDQVIANSPYLIDPIEQILRSYSVLSKIGSGIFLLGFFVEVINTIRSLL